VVYIPDKCVNEFYKLSISQLFNTYINNCLKITRMSLYSNNLIVAQNLMVILYYYYSKEIIHKKRIETYLISEQNKLIFY